ncbi:MAG TPA: type IV pilus assembly protein PilM [Patescibacteria group bacterium]|nr:type IV pilus assembly protein PilM [Patescibacteria group bacterium]
MNAVGFDLGSSSLKIVEDAKSGKDSRILKAIEFSHPFGTMLPQDSASMGQLAAMVKQTLVEKKIPTDNIRAALPESLISTKIISTPMLSDAELASAIDWLAEQNIAIPLEELSIEYEVLYRPDANKHGENMRVMLIGVPKKLIQNYMSFFAHLEVEPVVMETQVISILRSIMVPEMPTTLVVHMGANNTDFFIVHNGELVFVYSFPNGGRLLTRAVERGLNLDSPQAEEYKKTYGVDPTQLEGKMVGILQPVMQLFVGEMQKAMQFFTSQFGTLSVKRILLSGGGAHLPGILQYFTTQLNVETVIAHPFLRFQTDTKVQLPLDREASFIVACGLAMREA